MRLFRPSGSFTPAEILLFLLAFPAMAGDIAGNTLETGENLLKAPSSAVLLSGAAAAGLAHYTEPDTGCAGFLPERPFSAMDSCDDLLFGPALPLTSASVWAAGALLNNSAMEGTGEELCRGLLWTYATAGVLKYSTGRTRPDGSDDLSFPSAHAAGASCLAVVLWNRHGAAAGIPAAAAALYTCFSRVNMGVHFPSDAVLGAALGAACGLAASLKDESQDTSIGFTITIDSSGKVGAIPW